MSKTNASVAEKAVAKSNQKPKEERTDEEILCDIRKNLAARLAVTSDDVRWLLAQFDQVVLDAKHFEAIAATSATPATLADPATPAEPAEPATRTLRQVMEESEKEEAI